MADFARRGPAVGGHRNARITRPTADRTAVEARSSAARTGTDDADEIDLADVLEPVERFTAPAGDDADDVPMTFAELTGYDNGN
jgi:hypothetical protein